MSLWNVTLVVHSVMMPAVEMYIIILLTVMSMSQGLLQACFDFCKLSPEYSLIGRPDCDCFEYKQRNTRSTATHRPVDASSIFNDSGIYYEPAAIHSLPPSFVEQIFHSTNYIKHNKQQTSYDTIESLDDDISRQSPLATTHKYKRGDNIQEKMVNDESEIRLHLYLDLDLKPSENNSRTRLEELKNMFVQLHDAEKGLSECINLHIYIFSKYIDNFNNTNTNWGRIEYDNLSTSQELTEIQNKCDLPASIIRQSLYEVKQSFPQKQNPSENVQGQTSYTESATNLDISYTTVTTDRNNEYNDPIGSKIVKHNPTERTDSYSLYVDSGSTTNLPVLKDLSHTIAKGKDVSKLNSSVTTINENITQRTLLVEEELQIPRIITKELSNGSVISFLDGYEDLNNSDFITNNVISSTSEESTEEVSTSDNDLVEIKGNLYFLLGNNHIPARFIQQPGGEINIAMDGFSLCTQMLEENQSNFMNLLCKCIQQKKCTSS